MAAVISGAVEGDVDRAVFERLVRFVGAEPGPVHVTNGRPSLLLRLHGFNQAARYAPWLVLVDLDRDDCAPPFRRMHMRSAAKHMAFRVAVRAVEAWLLADRQRAARWLDVPLGSVPSEPEALPAPKVALVEIARRSRSRVVQADIAPRAGSGRQVGPLYTSQLINFIEDDRHGWRPDVAAQSSDSLTRCLRDLRRIATA